MKVIVILGLPLSGKTTHAKAVLEETNIELFETGTFVYKEVEKRGLEPNPENIVMVAGECKSLSDSYFTEKAIQHVRKTLGENVTIFLSGVKAESELNYLIQEVGEESVFMISFHASALTRHSRLLNKDRKEESTARGSKGIEDMAMAADRSRFNLRDNKELGYGLGRLIARAHYVINTEDKLWPYNNYDITLEQFKVVLNEIKSK